LKVRVRLSGMMPYERVEAGKKAHELVLLVDNISEGAAKKGSREYRRFLDISLGSFSEVTYCLKLAADLGYLSAEDQAGLEPTRALTGKMLWGLYQAVKRSAGVKG
jgi:hypothetical protein